MRVIYETVQASCSYFLAKMNLESPPQLTDDAVDWIRNIIKTHKIDPGTQTLDLLNRFINYYGTHISTKMKFGAKFLFQHKMTKADHDEFTEKNFNVENTVWALFTCQCHYRQDADIDQYCVCRLVNMDHQGLAKGDT